MLKAVRNLNAAEDSKQPQGPPDAGRPRWPAPPPMIQETHGSPFGFRTRKIPESPRLAQLAEWAISIGLPTPPKK